MRLAYADPPYLGCSRYYNHPDADLAEPITLRRGLTGAKPERFCRWVLDLLGVDGDTVEDLFPGTGVMSRVLDQAVLPL